MDFAVPVKNFKKSEKRDKYKALARELKKIGGMNWCTRKNPQKLGKETWRLRNRKTGDHSNASIIKIGQNTEKSPWDLRRLALSQIAVKNH